MIYASESIYDCREFPDVWSIELHVKYNLPRAEGRPLFLFARLSGFNTVLPSIVNVHFEDGNLTTQLNMS